MNIKPMKTRILSAIIVIVLVSAGIFIHLKVTASKSDFTDNKIQRLQKQDMLLLKHAQAYAKAHPKKIGKIVILPIGRDP